jgi:hypothetical protein
MRGRPWLLAWIAVSIGVLAAVLVWRSEPPQAGASAAGYYCYQLRQGWVCMRQRADCERRLAAEPAANVQKTCAGRSTDTVSP